MVESELGHQFDRVALVLVGHRSPSKIAVDQLQVVRVSNVCGSGGGSSSDSGSREWRGERSAGANMSENMSRKGKRALSKGCTAECFTLQQSSLVPVKANEDKFDVWQGVKMLSPDVFGYEGAGGGQA